MTDWIIGEQNTITLITHLDVNLVAFYTVSSASAYQTLGTPWTKNGNRYFTNAIFETLGIYTIRVVDLNSVMPDQFISINVINPRITALDIEANSISVAVAVRAELSTELNKINNQVDGLTGAQQTMLLEIYRIMGLDPTKPLIVTDTSRTAGAEIQQTVTTTPTQTIVTRP